ncbi:MAG: hypothetical protein JRF33_04610 [Deltaproteobacteria bacterium]|nr:hypothetical protein [Deltaproteobacteria bacterium]
MSRCLLLLALSLMVSPRLMADEAPIIAGGYAALETGRSIPNSIRYGEESLAIDFVFKFGWRTEDWGLFAQVGLNHWYDLEYKNRLAPTSLNPGLGAEWNYFEGRARSSVAVGPSVYMTEGTGEFGEVGFFVDLRPAAVRVPLMDEWCLVVDPLAFQFSVPVLSNIPLLVFEYYTVLGLEYGRKDILPPPERFLSEQELGLFFELSFHLTILSDDPERAMLAQAVGGAFRAGYRFSRVGLFLHVENDRWMSMELGGPGITDGVLNTGFGLEALLFSGRIRAAVTLGLSTLLMDTMLLDAGDTGFFFEWRPFGFRWSWSEHVYFCFDPLVLAVVAPELGENRLFMLQYRSILGLEVAL